jgi:hypothetical protein
VDTDVSVLVFGDVTLCRWVKWIPMFRDWYSGTWRYDIGWVESDVSGVAFWNVTLTLGEWIPTFRYWFSAIWRYNIGWVDSDVSGLVFWNVTSWNWVSGLRHFGTGILECDPITLGEWIPTFQDWSSGMWRYNIGWVDSDVSGLVFWNVTLWHWLSGFRRFQGTQYLHLQRSNGPRRLINHSPLNPSDGRGGEGSLNLNASYVLVCSTLINSFTPLINEWIHSFIQAWCTNSFMDKRNFYGP